jgi:transcriptional regulator with XRE-family HTH domain
MTPKKLLTVIRSLGEMSQVRVSKATGIPQSTISKIERGKVTDIKVKSFGALLALYYEVLATKEAGSLLPRSLVKE